MNRQKGANKEVFKRLNRSLLLKLLATGTCSSRVELARVMGLSKMAISNMVTELMAMELITEGATEQTEELGRKRITLRISPQSPKVAGIFIFREYCEAVLCDMELNVIARKRVDYRMIAKDELIEIIYALLDDVLGKANKVIGIGVASIGPVDIPSGTLNPKYFYGITNLPIVRLLENRYRLPVFLENDNQCGVLAEKLYGNGRNYTDIILVGVAIGVGCGVIVDGELYNNHQNLVPEFGHVSIDFRGNPCICGSRGCVETYISTPILLERLRTATESNGSFEEYCLQYTDPRVHNILADAIDKMSAALVNTINLLNTELILIGYDAVHYPDDILALLEKRVNGQKFAQNSAYIKIGRAHFMQDAQLMGAVCLVNRQIFRGDLPPV